MSHWDRKTVQKFKPPAVKYTSFNVAVPPEEKEKLRLLFQKCNLKHREQCGDSKMPMWKTISLILNQYAHGDDLASRHDPKTCLIDCLICRG